jgi:hypothetical protein
MRTISIFRPAALSLLMLLLMCAWIPKVSAQQYFQSNDANYLSLRDVSGNTPVTLSTFTAERYTGYNEIEWGALQETNTSKYIVEYSTNGKDYQTAGTIMPGSTYSFKHYMNDNRPTLYRLRAEELDGKYYYSGSIALSGESTSPVKIYPTIVTGSHVNLNAAWPVERISITRQDGSIAFVKDINGQKDYISVNIPALGTGMYFLTCFGNKWVTTDKILIP